MIYTFCHLQGAPTSSMGEVGDGDPLSLKLLNGMSDHTPPQKIPVTWLEATFDSQLGIMDKPSCEFSEYGKDPHSPPRILVIRVLFQLDVVKQLPSFG